MSRVLARRKSLLLFDPPAAADNIVTGPDPVSGIRAFQMGMSRSAFAARLSTLPDDVLTRR